MSQAVAPGGVVVLDQPAPGEVVRIAAWPGQRLFVNFDPAIVRLVTDGADLGLWFPGDGWIILIGLGWLLEAADAPVFVLPDGRELTSAQVFWTAEPVQPPYRDGTLAKRNGGADGIYSHSVPDSPEPPSVNDAPRAPETTPPPPGGQGAPPPIPQHALPTANGDGAEIRPNMRMRDAAESITESAPEVVEARNGGAAPEDIEPSAGDEPVYNVRIDEKMQARPLVLAHGVATTVRFDIGPRSAESIIPAVETGEDLERLAGGEPLPLSVTLDCLVCAEQTYFRGVITYDPATRRSDEVAFRIRPSRAAVARSGGYGLLILTVDVEGLDLAVIKVPTFVDAVSPAVAEHLVAPPPVTFVRPDVAVDIVPDLVIDIGGGVGKLPVGLNPVHPDLKSAFAALAGGHSPDRPFESGVTTADLGALVAELYKAQRAVVQQNEATIQTIYAARGQDLALGPGVRRLRFDDADQARALDILRRPGADLYRRIFMDGEPALRRAMQTLSRFAAVAGRPLRVRVRATDIYAPWQLLYEFAPREAAQAEGFWGFRYQIGTMQKINAAHAEQGVRTFLPALRPEEVIFGTWREDDDVGARAEEMHTQLVDLVGGQPLRARSRGEFLGLLDRRSRAVKLILFYGHATSGTVVLPGETAIASALSAQPTLATDWTGERLLFAANDLLVPPDIQDLVPYETYDDVVNPVFFKNRPIVILNACETGTGGVQPMNNNGFIGRFSLAGAGAVFVTEAPVWRSFAYHFGNDLLREIVAGRPMQAALFEARRRHLNDWGNPLGLLYSLYGNPALRIETPPH